MAKRKNSSGTSATSATPKSEKLAKTAVARTKKPAAAKPPEPSAATASTLAGSCKWSPDTGYRASTVYGEVKMFEGGGQRAVDLMLLSAAACLDFFLVEYATSRKLAVTSIKVHCEGEPTTRPERLARITTRVEIEGDITDSERHKMLSICEKACKVMNTLRQSPECTTELIGESGKRIT